MSKKLLLIDGHALIFRSYYAFLRRPMINSKGVDTSVLFGFSKTLIELILKEKPTHLAVAFDPPAKTFRHELYPQYKANRSETPETIKSALVPLCEIMETISVPVLMKPGFEADDVIGTVAVQAARRGFTVYMVTPDKDYGQIIGENIYQIKPGKSGGENELIGKEELCAAFGIEDPKQIVDILTIWGDASDNVPGVKGIGEVGSKKLITEYGSIENIYKSLEQLSEKQRSAFTEAESYIELSKRLITIDTDVDIPWSEEDFKLATPDFGRIKELFMQYEFTSLIRAIPQLENLFEVSDNSVQQKTTTLQESKFTKRCENVSPQELINLIGASNSASIKIDKINSVAVKLLNSTLLASISDYYAEFPIGSIDREEHILRKIFENGNISKSGYELKQIINLLRQNGIHTCGELYDIELMHYLLTPERSHKIEILAQSYFNIGLDIYNEKPQLRDLFSSDPDEESRELERAVKELSVIPLLKERLTTDLKDASLSNLYNDVEMPLIYVLADMEYDGIKIDIPLLNEYRGQLSKEVADIESTIRDLAGEPMLNISSPKQLGEVLYEKLKITGKAKKTAKKNYSTDEETLTELIETHPIVSQILEYRNIKKLLTTYIDPLPSLVSQNDNKIHTTYNQALTATGRLSSVRPNLQNIPIRTERGREIRKAFVPSHENGVIISADYSQIELRLMAHMSNDSDFITAFREGKDIHTATAAKVFGVAEEDVTREQRNRAKVANFGIIYGISAFGLSQRLKIPRNESKKLIEDYFASYPEVERYMRRMTEEAKVRGFVSTLYGRKRFLPDINSRNPTVRGVAERNAINAPIQGSAADIIKVAMVRLHRRVEREGFRSKMVLQVHDELVFDVYRDEADRLSEIIKEEMENVISLKIPLTIECHQGANWLEAH
jgi:DNA polymerase I